MSGLEKSIKSFGRKIDKEFHRAGRRIERNISDPIGTFVDDLTPDIPRPEEETIIPIPDERLASVEARRRRARKVGTGRDSTILTEGLGG